MEVDLLRKMAAKKKKKSVPLFRPEIVLVRLASCSVLPLWFGLNVSS